MFETISHFSFKYKKNVSSIFHNIKTKMCVLKEEQRLQTMSRSQNLFYKHTMAACPKATSALHKLWAVCVCVCVCLSICPEGTIGSCHLWVLNYPLASTSERGQSLIAFKAHIHTPTKTPSHTAVRINPFISRIFSPILLLIAVTTWLFWYIPFNFTLWVPTEYMFVFVCADLPLFFCSMC